LNRTEPSLSVATENEPALRSDDFFQTVPTLNDAIIAISKQSVSLDKEDGGQLIARWLEIEKKQWEAVDTFAFRRR
jgi:hypothetical protein